MRPDPGFIIDYGHEQNSKFHTLTGALAALRTLFPKQFPRSVLDLGCGTGTWLRASLECGADYVLGVDGANLRATSLAIPAEFIQRRDLGQPLDFGRRFDLVLCLETAEHVDEQCAETIIETITKHGDQILFSAATPDQPGTHHVNCQWPVYWQRLFNRRGFQCNDWPRWAIWGDPRIEPWYRQNLMIATRNEDMAGEEPRIEPVIHPAMIPHLAWRFFQENLKVVDAGGLPWHWYVGAPFKAAIAKARRAFETTWIQ